MVDKDKAHDYINQVLEKAVKELQLACKVARENSINLEFCYTKESCMIWDSEIHNFKINKDVLIYLVDLGHEE